MPRLNYGTLLENVVIVEVTRACLQRSAPGSALAFASSFSMPPLTQCWAGPSDSHSNPAFDQACARRLAERAPTMTSPADLWSRCVRNAPMLPVCRYREPAANDVVSELAGPNGALLAAMLAAHEHRILFQWINDDGARYGETGDGSPSSCSEVARTAEYAAALMDRPVSGTSVHVNGKFPGSVGALEQWLGSGPIAAAPVRIGFLDPDTYIDGKTNVSQLGHQRWLRALAHGCERSVSVLFMMCQNRGSKNIERNKNLELFDGDEKRLFARSLVFEGGNFQAGIKIRWTTEEISSVVAQIGEHVQRAWSAWVPKLPNLKVHVDGTPSN